MKKSRIKELERIVAHYEKDGNMTTWEIRHRVGDIKDALKAPARGLLYGAPELQQLMRVALPTKLEQKAQEVVRQETGHLRYAMQRIRWRNHRMPDEVHPSLPRRIKPAPKNPLCERLDRRKQWALRETLTGKGVRSMRTHETLEQLPEQWGPQIRAFCHAAARNVFVLGAEFDQIGTDLAMVYKLDCVAVAGRGYNREVKFDSPWKGYFGAKLDVDGETFYGAAKSRGGAIAAARGKAGEKAAAALGGDFDGGFL